MTWKERYIRMLRIQHFCAAVATVLLFFPVIILVVSFLSPFLGIGMAAAYQRSAVEAWFRPVVPWVTWWFPYGLFLEILLVLCIIPWLLAEFICWFKSRTGGPMPSPSMHLNAWQRLESRHPLWMLPRFLLTFCFYLVGIYLLTHLPQVDAFLHSRH